MRIWLIQIGEPLPVDGKGAVLMRVGQLADILVARQHEVLWWASTFNHMRKRFRFDKDTEMSWRPNCRFRLLHSIGYRTNVSVRRLVNLHRIARKFRRFAKEEPTPDVILCSYPSIELSVAAVQYGRVRGVPVVLDIRDLWPETFLDVVPRFIRGVSRLLLAPMFRHTRIAFSGASAITAITPDIVKWGLNHAGRDGGRWDRDFPLAYDQRKPLSEEISCAEQFWRKHGISQSDGAFTACFVGTFGRRRRVETIVEAARIVEEQGCPIRFVLCGTGDTYTKCQDMAKDSSNVVFAGYVERQEIWMLMRIASVGLAPYESSSDFMASIPNKPIEYFSAGLPVISTLKGTLEELLSVHGCGITCPERDADALASTLIELYHDRERLDTMARNALQVFSDRFAGDKVYGEMCDYLEYVAKSLSGSQGEKGTVAREPRAG